MNDLVAARSSDIGVSQAMQQAPLGGSNMPVRPEWDRAALARSRVGLQSKWLE
jgi:hypothetical protein